MLRELSLVFLLTLLKELDLLNMFQAGPQDIFVGRILVISSSGSMIRQERNDKISAGRMV